MRINKGRVNRRPGKGRGEMRVAEGQMSMSLLSRPYATPQEVPRRPRQSSVSSQHDSDNGLHGNPQWMKKLEEKYRKLHMKIGSYSGSGDRLASSYRHQHLAGMSQYGAAFNGNQRKTPLTNDEKHLDLIRLGMSMDRYGKRSKQYNFQTRRTELHPIPGSSYAAENRVPAPDTTGVHLDRVSITETSVETRANALGEETLTNYLTGISHFNVGNGPLNIAPTTQGSEPNDSDKHSMSCVQSTRDVIEISDEDTVDSRVFVKETTSNSGNGDDITDHNDRSKMTVRSIIIQPGTQNLQVPVPFRVKACSSQRKSAKENVENSISTSSKLTNFQQSKSSKDSSGSSRQQPKSEVDAAPVAPMSKTSSKVRGKRHINVFQGMSEEAQFAITETKKEMGVRMSRSYSESACHVTPGGDVENGVTGDMHTRPMSEKISYSLQNDHRKNLTRPDPSDVSSKGSAKEGRREKAFSPASVETLIDETSDHTNCSLGSFNKDNQSDQYTKLPEIDTPRSNGQHSIKYLKNSQQHNPGLSRYRVLTCMAREQTFEITPPGYDVRFRDILTCEIPESETPPPDIKAQAVAKCSEWLTTKFLHSNTKPGSESTQ